MGFSKTIPISNLEPACAVIVRYPRSPSPQPSPFSAWSVRPALVHILAVVVVIIYTKSSTTDLKTSTRSAAAGDGSNGRLEERPATEEKRECH